MVVLARVEGLEAGSRVGGVGVVTFGRQGSGDGLRQWWRDGVDGDDVSASERADPEVGVLVAADHPPAAAGFQVVVVAAVRVEVAGLGRAAVGVLAAMVQVAVRSGAAAAAEGAALEAGLLPAAQRSAGEAGGRVLLDRRLPLVLGGEVGEQPGPFRMPAGQLGVGEQGERDV